MSDEKENILPDGWAIAKLEDIVDILDSFRVPINSSQRNQRTGNVPYYGATGQVGLIDNYIFDEELILLGEDGAPFFDFNKPKAYLIQGKSWVNNHAHVLRSAGGISNQYLLHQLNSINYRKFVSGTTRLKLPQAAMRSIPLAIAPLSEQRRIVTEIDKRFARLDEGIAALQRIEEDLSLYRASVLKAACEGRLVPTAAALAVQQKRHYEPASALLQKILKKRRLKWERDQLAKMKAQGKKPKDNKWKENYVEPEEPSTGHLLELPEGWVWASMSQLAEIQGGVQKQPKRRPGANAYPFLRVANVLRGRLDLTEIHQIELFGDELEKLRLMKDDLLIVEGNGSINEIGRMAIWNGEIKNCVHQNHIIRARTDYKVNSNYISAYWNSPIGNSRLVSVASSTSGLYTLSISKVGKIIVPLPPLTEQKRIVAEVESRLRLIEELENTVALNLARAKELRRSILQRAFTGRLVHQDREGEDEHASVLLERIAAERQHKAEEAMKEKRQKSRRKLSDREPVLFKPKAKSILRGFQRKRQILPIEEAFERGGYSFQPNDEGEHADVDAFFAQLSELLTRAAIALDQSDLDGVLLRRSAR